MKIHLQISFLLMVLLLSGCNFKQREAELQKKSDELLQKEQQLLAWEKNLSLKEDSIQKIISKTDSIYKTDSIAPVPQTLEGEWMAKMICIQTNCAGSAIGDVQSDTWRIGSRDSALIIQSITRGQVNRVYTGNYFRGNTIRVSDKTESQASANSSVRLVEITEIRDNKMKGTRTVIQPDGCQIVYSLDLDKKQ